jgi:hypothetical protein
MISVLEVGDGVFEVLSTSGDTHLGGDDFDKVSHLLSFVGLKMHFFFFLPGTKIVFFIFYFIWV